MLIPSLFTLKSRHALVRDIYRKYLKATAEFTQVMEHRALQVSPDHKATLQNCFRLQHLLIEQRMIRFEYLLKSRTLDCAAFKTLGEVSERLDKNWDGREEAAILRLVEPFGNPFPRSTSASQAREPDWPPGLVSQSPFKSVATSYSKESNSHYAAVSKEIDHIQSKWNAAALTEPLRSLEQDPQYRAALAAIADRVQELGHLLC
jgi:hypothetical protein